MKVRITTKKVCEKKKCFASYEEAMDFLHHMSRRYNANIINEQFPYNCLLCRQWHLTTKTGIPFVDKELARQNEQIISPKKTDPDTEAWQDYVQHTKCRKI